MSDSGERVWADVETLEAFEGEVAPTRQRLAEAAAEYQQALAAFRASEPNDLGGPQVVDLGEAVAGEVQRLEQLDQVPGRFAHPLRHADRWQADAWAAASCAQTGTAEHTWEVVSSAASEGWRGFRDEITGLGELARDLLPGVSQHDDGAPGAWTDLGSGLVWGVRNPGEFLEAAAGLHALDDEGLAYWSGMMLPGAVATVASGGAGAAGRGARIVRRARRAADRAPEGRSRRGSRPRTGRAPDPESLRGFSADDIRARIPEDWEELPSHHGGGTRFRHPTRSGEQVRTMPGDPDARAAIKQGPYAIVSRDGTKSRIPLAGNPTLR